MRVERKMGMRPLPLRAMLAALATDREEKIRMEVSAYSDDPCDVRVRILLAGWGHHCEMVTWPDREVATVVTMRDMLLRETEFTLVPDPPRKPWYKRLRAGVLTYIDRLKSI